MQVALVPVGLDDEPAHVLEPACALAHRVGATVVAYGWHWDPGEASALRRILHGALDRLGVPAEVDVDSTEHRSPVDPLLAAAARHSATVVMRTRGLGRVGAAVLGSVAEGVVARATDPVVLLGPEVTAARLRADGPVLVALDGSPAAEQALPVAVAWSRALGTGVEVVGVVEPDAGAAIAASGEAVPAVEAGYLTTVARRTAADASWEVLHGPSPARVLADHAAGAQLLVMTTHGRTGLARVVAGSVTLATVRDARCPVVVVRPPGLA